jgi:hypothetical protein
VAKYYFNIVDGRLEIPCHGEDLPSLQAARCHAIKYAGQILCDEDPGLWDRGDWELTVSDELGWSLFTIIILTANAPSTASAFFPA